MLNVKERIFDINVLTAVGYVTAVDFFGHSSVISGELDLLHFL